MLSGFSALGIFVVILVICVLHARCGRSAFVVGLRIGQDVCHLRVRHAICDFLCAPQTCARSRVLAS